MIIQRGKNQQQNSFGTTNSITDNNEMTAHICTRMWTLYAERTCLIIFRKRIWCFLECAKYNCLCRYVIGLLILSPRLWNRLPLMIKSAESVDVFRSTLKTFHLFEKVHNYISIYIYIYIYIYIHTDPSQKIRISWISFFSFISKSETFI